ncbi:MAG: hypothetical protein JSV26_07855 [bacterium]|nr:MAG: hypothetical protein JSV26_07855 [bacterium]
MSEGDLKRILDELEDAVEGLLGRLEGVSGRDGKGDRPAPERESKAPLHRGTPAGEEAAELIKRAIKRLRSI